MLHRLFLGFNMRTQDHLIFRKHHERGSRLLGYISRSRSNITELLMIPEQILTVNYKHQVFQPASYLLSTFLTWTYFPVSLLLGGV